MRENTVKTIWADGGVVKNGWLHIPTMWSAELMAHAGWDSLTIDTQHGMAGIETAVQMMQAISTTDVIPMARVAWNDPAPIGRLLDGGAYGIICPMINNRAECDAFVGAVRYPPMGYRSSGPTRASVYAGSDYRANANSTVLAIAMIETKDGVDNVEEITATPGLDSIYVGPSDLNLSVFGKLTVDQDDPEYIAVLERILAACKNANITAGIHCGSVTDARRMMDMGFQLVTVQSDGGILSNAAKNIVAGLLGDEADNSKREMY